MSSTARYPSDRLPKRLARRLVKRLGYRVLRERALPRGLDPVVDLLETPGFPRGGVAVDVGANVGQTIEQLLAPRAFSRILACEPSPAAFAILEDRYRGHRKVVLEQVALGASPGWGCLRVLAPTSEQNCLIPWTAADASSIEVRVDTLWQLVARHGVESVALLKIDTEGAEIEVLQGARPLLEAGRIEAILAECGMSSEDRSHGSFDELYRELRAIDFALLGLYDIHHQDRQIHYCNALFVRR